MVPLATFLMLCVSTAYGSEPTPTPNPGGILVDSDGDRIEIGPGGVVVEDADGSAVEIGNGGIRVKDEGRAGRGGPAAGVGRIDILDSEESRDVDCGGKELHVAGSENTLVVRNCSRVVVVGSENKIRMGRGSPALNVSGSDNVITAEELASVSTSGSDNVVTWTKPAAGMRGPNVSNAGSGNAISRKK